MPEYQPSEMFIVTEVDEGTSSAKNNQVLITHNGVYLTVEDQKELIKENKGTSDAVLLLAISFTCPIDSFREIRRIVFPNQIDRHECQPLMPTIYRTEHGEQGRPWF